MKCSFCIVGLRDRLKVYLNFFKNDVKVLGKIKVRDKTKKRNMTSSMVDRHLGPWQSPCD